MARKKKELTPAEEEARAEKRVVNLEKARAARLAKGQLLHQRFARYCEEVLDHLEGEAYRKIQYIINQINGGRREEDDVKLLITTGRDILRHESVPFEPKE